MPYRNYDNLGRYIRPSAYKRLHFGALSGAVGLSSMIAKKAYKYYNTPAAKAMSAKGGAAPLRGRRAAKPRKKWVKKKSNQKLSKDVVSIKRHIKEMKQENDASLGTMTYRANNASALVSAVNSQAVVSHDSGTTGDLEYALGFLKYYNPANPGTLTTADGSTGTYQRNILFKSITTSLELRNNYQTDAQVKIYLCKCKDDTDLSPYSAYNSSIADGGNAAAITDLNQFPNDYELLKDMWSMKVVLNSTLSPGQTAKVSHSVSDVEYSPSTVDTHALSYQREYKAYSFLVVVNGTIAHDTTLSEQGICQAGVDIVRKRTYVVQYNAGTNIKYIHLIGGLNSFTNGAVQSHQPIPDNVGYSVA